jgi:adenine phosphoribosyltransferase
MTKQQTAKDTLRRLYDAVREVPDFPSAGIVFRDLTPIFLDPVLFRQAVRRMSGPARELNVDKVLGIEAGGFILGGPLSAELKAGFLPARKAGKLPHDTHQVPYGPAHGSDAIEVHQDAVEPGERVIIVDDVLATGGTARAAVRAVEEAGGEVVGVSVLLELLELDGRSMLDPVPLWSVLTYPRKY